jgi:hypothetical protein
MLIIYNMHFIFEFNDYYLNQLWRDKGHFSGWCERRRREEHEIFLSKLVFSHSPAPTRCRNLF